MAALCVSFFVLTRLKYTCVVPGQRGVNLTFEAGGQGLSYEHIAWRLNEEDFKTRQGKPFQAMTVYRIVKRNGGGV